VWKEGKIPYDPTLPNTKANIKDILSWGSFEQADAAYNEGGWDGVGFVLTGNGIAGVDLDNCVVDGVLNPDAIQFLTDIDAAYIEFSPSGNGVHALGFAKNLINGVKGKLGGLSVELYTSKRYLTVTGHVIKSEPFRELVDFHDFTKKIRPKLTEDTDSNSSVSSVSSVSTVMDFPASAIPYAIGQRHRTLFELARWVKGVEPNASIARQMKIVKCWHSQFLHIIGTKEFEASWTDFRYSLPRVKQPYGATLQSCLSNLPSSPDIPELHLYGEKAVHLMRICMALQIHHSPEPFYLSCRTAGDLLGCNHTDAAKLFQIFVTEGWLIEVRRGAGSKATRYKLNIDWS
jgi:hypothetical protein